MDNLHPLPMATEENSQASLARSLFPHLEVMANVHYLLTMTLAQTEDIAHLLRHSNDALTAMVKLVTMEVNKSSKSFKSD